MSWIESNLHKFSWIQVNHESWKKSMCTSLLLARPVHWMEEFGNYFLLPHERINPNHLIWLALLREFNCLLCCSIPHHTLTLVYKGLWQVQEPNINDKIRENSIIMKLYFSEEPCGQFLTFSNGNDSKYLIYLTGRKNSMNLVFYGLLANWPHVEVLGFESLRGVWFSLFLVS